jgi:hypothetical protein
VANSITLLKSMSPGISVFDVKRMRIHFKHCLESGILTNFPTLAKISKVPAPHQTIYSTAAPILTESCFETKNLTSDGKSVEHISTNRNPGYTLKETYVQTVKDLGNGESVKKNTIAQRRLRERSELSNQEYRAKDRAGKLNYRSVINAFEKKQLQKRNTLSQRLVRLKKVEESKMLIQLQDRMHKKEKRKTMTEEEERQIQNKNTDFQKIRRSKKTAEEKTRGP